VSFTDQPVGLSEEVELDLRQRIIHESLKLFSLKGFLNTSIDDILQQTKASKGGLYNHFKSKDHLFLAVLAEARAMWRERVLFEVNGQQRPLDNVRLILTNYRERYLKDENNIPGGCVFVTLSVELDDQRPDFAKEIWKGFLGVKSMMKRFLDQAKASGELRNDVDTEAVSELLFSGMIGASVVYGMQKTDETLRKAINPLIEYVHSLETPGT